MHHIPFVTKTLKYIDNEEIVKSREQKSAIQSVEGDLHFGKRILAIPKRQWDRKNDRQPGNN